MSALQDGLSKIVICHQSFSMPECPALRCPVILPSSNGMIFRMISLVSGDPDKSNTGNRATLLTELTLLSHLKTRAIPVLHLNSVCGLDLSLWLGEFLTPPSAREKNEKEKSGPRSSIDRCMYGTHSTHAQRIFFKHLLAFSIRAQRWRGVRMKC